MVVVRDSDIKKAILTALSRQGDPATLNVNVPTAIDGYIADPLLRTNCYNMFLTIAEEDSAKRISVSKMLCTYVIGFPPDEVVLKRMEAVCERFIDKCPEEERTLRDLLTLVKALLEVRTMNLVVAQPTASNTAQSQYTPYGEQRSLAPAYVTQLPPFQPFVDAGGYTDPSSSSSANNNGPSSPAGGANSIAPPLNANLPASTNASRQSASARIPFPRILETDKTAIVEEKNALIKKPRVLFQPVSCRDYTAQTRLTVTRELLEQQVKALGTYDDNYKTNPTVIRATNFLLKVICDAYVAKMPVCGGGGGSDGSFVRYSLLREVSLAFVSIFLKLLESEYLCVRLHLFDILLTLSVHMQLMDTGGMFKGLMQYLQGELTWLYGRVLEKMARTETVETVWMASLKSSLATLPPSALATLDPQVLRQWMLLPSVASCHPHIYSALAEAFCCRLLGIVLPLEGLPLSGGLPSSSRRQSCCTVVGAPEYTQASALDRFLSSASASSPLTSSPLILDESYLLAALGPHGVEEVLQLYHNAYTVSSRFYLFMVLYALSAWRCVNGFPAGGIGGGGISQQQRQHQPLQLSPQYLARTLRILVAKSFHWHLRTLLCYQSHSLAKDLPPLLLGDLDMGEVRELKGPVTTMVGSLLALVASYRRLPEMLSTMLHHTADDFFALGQVARECCSVLPYMVREDTDHSLKRTAGQLVYHLLRVLRSPQHERQALIVRGTDDDAIATIVNTIASSTIVKLRDLAPDALSAIAILCRTNPQHGATCIELLRASVAKEKNPAQLMSITYALADALTIQHGSLQKEGDVISLSAQGELRIMAKSAELVGVQTFWSLYWGLRHSQPFACQRARFLLITILAALPQKGSSAMQIAMWIRCMADPYPPVAFVASQQVVRLAAVSHHRVYEWVVDKVQSIDASKAGNPYAMATYIWHTMDAESRMVVE